MRFLSILILALCGQMATCKNSQTGNVTTDETTLYKKLFEGYDARARPVINANDSVLVKIALRLIQLKEVNTKAQFITIVGWIATYWTDPRFTWDPADYNGRKSIQIFPNQVWVPTYVLGNSVDTVLYSESVYTLYKVTIFHDGQMYWSPSGQFSADCGMDLRFFPFDDQICEFRFENWVYVSTDVNMTYTENATSEFNQALQDHQEWKIQGMTTDRNDTSYISEELYPKVYFRIHLVRKPMYYIYTVIVQVVFLCFLILGMFKLPAESGERISMSLTILLAFSLLLLYIVDQLPNSQVIPLINWFLLFVLAITVLAVLETVLVLYMFDHKGTRPPSWLITLNDKVFLHILCKSKRKDSKKLEKTNMKNKNTNSDIEMEETIPNLTLRASAICYSGGEQSIQSFKYITASEQDESDQEIANVRLWRHISRNIDRLSFWGFSIIMGLIILICLIIIPYGHKMKEL